MPRAIRILPSALLLLVLAAGAASARLESVTVAMVHDDPAAAGSGFVQDLRSELVRVLEGDHRVTLLDEPRFTGDGTYAGLAKAVNAASTAPGVDLVVCSGAIGSAAALHMESRPLPIVAGYLIDAGALPEPAAGVGSGLANFTYVTSTRSFTDEMAAFKSVVPDLESVVILASDGIVAALRPLTRPQVAWEEAGLEFRVVRAGTDAASALAALPANAEAVLLPPLVGFLTQEVDALLAGLTDRGLPSFAFEGEELVSRGALVGTSPREWSGWLVRRIALNARKILAGEDTAALPVLLAGESSLYINMRTARAIDLAPPFAVLADAVPMDAENDQGRRLTLPAAMAEAVVANRDLQAEAAALASARAQLASSRANLLPQLDANISGSAIDEDRATAARRPSERSATAGASLNMVLWSDDAHTGYSTQKRAVEQQEAVYEQARLDVVQEAATAYVQVLRALTAERIQRDNIMVSRRNLERARLRKRLGVASRAEELRWQSKIATEKAAMIDAQAGRNQAEIELNRVLGRPLEEPFRPAEPDLEASLSLMLDPRVSALMTNAWDLRRLRGFVVDFALAESPELAQLDAALAAQGRVVTNAKRAFYVPDVNLGLSWSRYLDESGAGAGDRPGWTLDDDEWSAALTFSLPLFEGGRRFSERDRAGRELIRLREQRAAAAQRIEQRVRSAVHSTSANYAAIELSREASVASRENLELVNDSYVRGAVDLITLLDAQSAFLQAELASADAVYAFLLDLMETERSVGAFTVFADQDARRDWLDTLERWFANEE